MQQTKKQLFFEILRFLIVGVVATIVDYLVFGLFDTVILPPIMPSTRVWNIVSLSISTAFGFCAGLVINWILSIKFVYKAVKNPKEAQSKKSFIIFTIIGIIGLILTEVGMIGLVAVFPTFKMFGTIAILGTTWEKWVAKVIMTCIVLVWNYLARKILIFK